MSVLFNNIDILTIFKRDWVTGIANTHFSGKLPDDDFLVTQLTSSEAAFVRSTSVPVEPTEIFSDEPTAAERSLLGTTPYEVEPGYDMKTDFFSPSHGFGTLSLRVRPVISVSSIKLIYPSFSSTVFDIPISWVRLDKKYGNIKIVPGAGTLNAPLSIFMAQALSSGNTIPDMIRVRYTAGILLLDNKNADVLNLIMKMAALSTLQNAFVPQSESISVDGVSQSKSVDIGKMKADVRDDLETVKQRLLGPIFGFM